MTAEELNSLGLSVDDIPLHDATRDLIEIGEKFEAGYQLTQQLEILTDQLHHTRIEREKEKKMTSR